MMDRKFNVSYLMREHLAILEGYKGVEPPETLAAKAMIPLDMVIKLNGNENPFGCSPNVYEALANFKSYHLYPDPEQITIRGVLSKYVAIGTDQIVAGNGCDELIDLLMRIFLGPGDSVVDCTPTFGMYSFTAKLHGANVVNVPRDENFSVNIDEVSAELSTRAKIVFIASPNNPTGNLTPVGHIQRLLDTGAIVVVDETYHEFCGATVVPLIGKYQNLVVLRTLSKWAGLAGLRFGYGLMSPNLVAQLIRIKPPYNVNAAAEVAAHASLNDSVYLMRNVSQIVHERDRMSALLSSLPGVKPLPSEGNFILCQFPEGKGPRIYQELALKGIFVRYFDTPRLKDHLRISVGLTEHTKQLIGALEEILR
jgi:histidinol-phosphate aminotransferase